MACNPGPVPRLLGCVGTDDCGGRLISAQDNVFKLRKPSIKTSRIKFGGIFPLERFLLGISSTHKIPGSLVSEPKHRDSRVRNRNRIGIRTDISPQLVPESESEPKFQLR